MRKIIQRIIDSIRFGNTPAPVINKRNPTPVINKRDVLIAHLKAQLGDSCKVHIEDDVTMIEPLLVLTIDGEPFVYKLSEFKLR